MSVDRDRFRVEADCAMRDYDDLEVSHGIAVEALQAIADKRPNKMFDPWAAQLAADTLAALAARLVSPQKDTR